MKFKQNYVFVDSFGAVRTIGEVETVQDLLSTRERLPTPVVSTVNREI